MAQPGPAIEPLPPGISTHSTRPNSSPTLTSTTALSPKRHWLGDCVVTFPDWQEKRGEIVHKPEGITLMKASFTSFLDPTDDGIIEQLSRKSFREGEERLLYAMVENAIEDYQKYVSAMDKKGKELFQQAEEWFFETDSSSEFSFENICDYLKLNACYVRKGLLHWKNERRYRQPTQRLAS
jgi:hypothetical protein